MMNIRSNRHETKLTTQNMSKTIATGLMGTILCLAGTTADVDAQTVRHVKASGLASATNSTSWNTACSDLQAVIDVSSPGDMVFVAEGVYVPIRPVNNRNVIDIDNRNNAFVLKEGVKVYGGFPADANDSKHRSPESRNMKQGTHFTILSGDLGIRNDYSDNAYHVVVGANIPNNGETILDGFTLTGGNADFDGGFVLVNESAIETNAGGGVFNVDASPVLVNLIIRENLALQGGGICNIDSHPRLSNISICNNIASDGNGGGLYNSHSNPVLGNVEICNNKAENAGAIYNIFSSPKLTDVLVCKNKANNVGGICNLNSSPSLVNVTTYENSASRNGGGVYNQNSYPKIVNCYIYDRVIQ